MIIRGIAFTEKGRQWGGVLGFPVDRGVPVMQWAREHFNSCDALLFIGACGIAVRAVAPMLKDKTTDPAVVVMDEEARHVIPLLSGHIGGANALAREIALKTGAETVLTTATDLRGMTAADTWAAEHGCAIENPAAIRAVSAFQLAGGLPGVAITEREIAPPFPVTLYLRPRTLTLGAGCRRDTDPEAFEAKARAFLKECGVSLLSVKALATIDVKREEKAFLRFCEKYRFPLRAYSAQELKAVPGCFSHSDFVEKTVGVDNVCERAAAAEGGRLLTGKTVMDGVTFALAGDENT